MLSLLRVHMVTVEMLQLMLYLLVKHPANAPDVSTRFLEKGDFLRVQNLAIGYNFNLDGDGFIKNLRTYANVQNLFVFTPYTGLDPEVNVNKSLNDVPSLGIDYTAFPRPRTLTVGLNVTF